MDKQILVAGKTLAMVEDLKRRYQSNEMMDSGWSESESSSIARESQRILFALID